MNTESGRKRRSESNLVVVPGDLNGEFFEQIKKHIKKISNINI